MRLIDADELIEHVWRDRLDSRERIATLIDAMPTITIDKLTPIDVAYATVVWAWLKDYRDKARSLKGRYTPKDVLTWVLRDWNLKFIAETTSDGWCHRGKEDPFDGKRISKTNKTD